MNLADIKNVNVGEFADLETSLSSRVTSIADARNRFAKIADFPGWSGAAKAAAKKSFQDTEKSLLDDVARVSAVHEMARNLKTEFTYLQSQVDALKQKATALSATLNNDGNVQFPPDPKPDDAHQQQAHVIQEEAHQLIEEAKKLDACAAVVLAEATSGDIHAGPEATSTDDPEAQAEVAEESGRLQGEFAVREPPDMKGDPADSAGWWNSLSPEEKQNALAMHPEWLGNRDGIPAAVRDQANRALLPKVKDDLNAQKAHLEKQLADYPDAGAQKLLREGLTRVEHKLQDLDKIQQALDQHKTNDPNRAFLLLLDMQSGEYGKAAISIGDPSTADRVSVATPGKDSSVHQSMTSMTNEAIELKNDTERILRNQGSHETVATVAWIGYEPPNEERSGTIGGFWDASGDARAKSGAPDLAHFYQGIAASWNHAPGDTGTGPHITALGHSYGSLTTSLALQQLPPGVVENAVFYGSPGIGIGSQPMDTTPDSIPHDPPPWDYGSIDTLHLNPGHAFNMMSDDDPIRNVGNQFGAYLESIPWMQQLSTRDGYTTADETSPGVPVHHEQAHGHSDYPRDKDGQLTMAGYDMAAVIAGHPELATKAR